MPMTVGKITLFMGPDTLSAPDNLEQAIINFINSANKSLKISVQELDHKPIADAIIAAKRRGVSVHMIMEQDYLKEKKLPKLDSLGTQEINRDILTRILRSGIDAKADYNPNIFHQKFIIKDKKSVLTGSTNFTTTGVTKNLNHVAVIDDPILAREYSREFAQIRKGIFGSRSKHSRKPLEDHIISNVRIKPLFAPDHNPEMEIIKQMIKAQTRIDFAVFTFSQSSGIDDAIVNAKRLNLQVRGVLDRKQANQKWAAKSTLVDAGVTLFTNKTGTGVRKIHHKIMTIDDQLTIIGSFNYTAPANLTNDENIIIFGDLDETNPSAIREQKKLALYARSEIDRIINDQSELLV
ncbi:MAG TPA: DUF1669 domain-containing protein [Thiotrichaceae bacterium]|nr:DUF1669 domain-containing protein [Thiotrichaceae bacterium]